MIIKQVSRVIPSKEAEEAKIVIYKETTKVCEITEDVEGQVMVEVFSGFEWGGIEGEAMEVRK